MKKPQPRKRTSSITELSTADLTNVLGGIEDIGTPTTYTTTGSNGTTVIEVTGARVVYVQQEC